MDMKTGTKFRIVRLLLDFSGLGPFSADLTILYPDGEAGHVHGPARLHSFWREPLERRAITPDDRQEALEQLEAYARRAGVL